MWIVIEGVDSPETCDITLDYEQPGSINKVFETEEEAVKWADENIATEWAVVQVTS